MHSSEIEVLRSSLSRIETGEGVLNPMLGVAEVKPYGLPMFGDTFPQMNRH